MPELPEVEILVTELSSKIIDRRINKTIQNQAKLRKKIPELTTITNETILKVSRIHKYIVITTNYHHLIIHLGMTGRLLLNNEFTQKKHTHVIIELNNSLFLSYEDPRRFWLIELLNISEYPKEQSIRKHYSLGQEPLSNKFTINRLKALTSKYPRQNIKKFLMDYKIICGIGNIYACEILFLSKISPYKTAQELSEEDIVLIYLNIKKVLRKAISLGGSSISDYVHSNGEKGNMQNFYTVYNKENKKCEECNQLITKIKQNGRSTYFCPSCQI